MKRSSLLHLLFPVMAVVVACGGNTVDLGGAPQQTGGVSDAGTTTPATGANDGPDASAKVPNPGGGIFDFEATATGPLPPGAKAVVLWVVSATSPDYVYAYGGGTTSGTQVFVSFSANPPEEAINAGKIAIGFVAAVDAATPIAEGKVTDGDVESPVTFVSADYAVIWRATDEALTKSGWDGAFPKGGYACGRCVRKSSAFTDSGYEFDEFEPVDCSEMTLVPAATADLCNWT